MTHPTDPVAAMREACAVRVKQHADMMEDADAEGSTYTSAGIVRKLRRLAVELSSLPLPAAPAHDAVGDGIQHDMETRCPKCGQDYRLHNGDEVECVCPTPARDGERDEKGGE